MPFEVRNKIAIITGSAQGLGKEFARRILEKGGKVCLSDVNIENGEKTLKEFSEVYGKDFVTFKRCDVSNEDDWSILWEHAETFFADKVSILVNNAGVGAGAGWKVSINVMLLGVGFGTFQAIEKMGISKGGYGGRIINIASVAGLRPIPKMIEHVGYGAAKHGVVAMTRSFAPGPFRDPTLEDSDPIRSSEGIKAYALCPVFADTQLVRDSIKLYGKSKIEDLEKETKCRVMDVSEVGQAFDLSLKNDKNGACYVVYPDCPPCEMPDNNVATMLAMVGFGQYMAAPLSFETFNWKHAFIGIFTLLVFIYMLLCVLF